MSDLPINTPAGPAPEPASGDEAYLARAFTHHPPKEGQQERYVGLRAHARSLAELILAHCPTSRERQIALTRLEEAVMWANASIARNE